MNTLVNLAILPGILIIVYIFKKDKVEPEPIKLIIKLVLFGVISCFPAILFETFMEGGMPISADNFQQAVYEAFFVAALCEEICKFGLLFLGSWRSKSFDYRFDGIVYGVCVACGFAIFENVEYVLSYGLGTAIVRAFLAVPLHAFCGVFMGACYSLMKKASIDGKGLKTFFYLILSLIIPMAIHGVYDTMAMLEDSTAEICLLVFVVCLYIGGIAFIRKMSKDDWKAGFYDYNKPRNGQSYETKYTNNNGQQHSDIYANGYSNAAANGYASKQGQARPSITLDITPSKGLRATTYEVIYAIISHHADAAVDTISTSGNKSESDREMPFNRLYHSLDEFNNRIDEDYRNLQMANPDMEVDFSITVSKVALPYSSDFNMKLNYHWGEYVITLTSHTEDGLFENVKILFELEKYTSIRINGDHRQALENLLRAKK